MDSNQSAHPFDQLLDVDSRVRGRSLPSSDAEGPAQHTGGSLALRLNEWRLLFPLNEASEIIPVPRITRVPGVKPWLMGIANLRGMVITAVDLRAFLCGKPAALTSSSRLVVVRSDSWGYGLLVDEIIGMRHFGPDAKMQDLDSVDAEVRRFLLGGYLSDGAQWLCFDTARLLNDTKFLGAATLGTDAT